MAVYLMMLLGLCAVNVVLTVFILRLYHRSESKPISRCCSRIIIKLRRLLCYPAPKGNSIGPDPTSEDLKPETGSKRIQRDAHRSPHVITNAFDRPKYGTLTSGKHDGKSVISRKFTAKKRSVRNTATEDNPRRDNDFVSGKVAAETLDLLLFIVCTVLSMGTTGACLLMLFVGPATTYNTSLT